MSDFEFKSNVKAVNREVESRLQKALEECGLKAEGFAKKNLTESGAVDTGNLRNSVTHKVVEEGTKVNCYIGTNVEYAPYIEFGTGIHYAGGRQTPWLFTDRNGETHLTRGMIPRPYLKPAIADNADVYTNIIKSNLNNI